MVFATSCADKNSGSPTVPTEPSGDVIKDPKMEPAARDEKPLVPEVEEEDPVPAKKKVTDTFYGMTSKGLMDKWEKMDVKAWGEELEALYKNYGNRDFLNELEKQYKKHEAWNEQSRKLLGSRNNIKRGLRKLKKDTLPTEEEFLQLAKVIATHNEAIKAIESSPLKSAGASK